jgi:hypothetical protein
MTCAVLFSNDSGEVLEKESKCALNFLFFSFFSMLRMGWNPRPHTW